MTTIWIHGFPLSSRIFDRQRTIAASEHFTPDLAGFGSAAPPAGELSIDDYARDVLAQADQKGIGRATFAGLSMGGYICFAIARIAPERMSGLLLIDTRETADTAEARKGRYDTIEKVKDKGISVVVNAMLPKMLTPAAPATAIEEVRQIMNSSTPEGVTAALRAMAERPDSTEVMSRIQVPTLVVVGDADSITPPEDAQRMAKGIPGAKLVTIRGAAHLSNFEQPRQFNEAVAAFLTGR